MQLMEKTALCDTNSSEMDLFEIDKNCWRRAIEALPAAARNYVLSTYTFKSSTYWFSDDQPSGIGIDLRLYIGKHRYESGLYVNEIKCNLRNFLKFKAKKYRAGKFHGENRMECIIENDIDKELLEALMAACRSAKTVDPGFIYFKRWTVSENIRWWKVGITSSMDRRETEQNVLPVPEELMASVECANLSEARSFEKAIHWVLRNKRIHMAQNRELFTLTEQEENAVLAAFELLGISGSTLKSAKAVAGDEMLGAGGV